MRVKSISSHDNSTRFRILSSIAADVWQETQMQGAYEWWYFDFVSDDGRDLFVVIFLSDFVFSPRYNRRVSNEMMADDVPASRAPAIAITWYRDGRPLLRSINEHTEVEFDASPESPACRIGQSHFCFVPKRGSYQITLNAPLRRGRSLDARIEWQVTTGDFDSAAPEAFGCRNHQTAHEWNLVAPRCRVEGALTISKGGSVLSSHQFRGTGYHDHNRDARPLPQTLADWQWGRAHFSDVTAIFYRYCEIGATPVTRLLLAQDDGLKILGANYEGDDVRLHHFGLRYPRRLRFAAKDAASSATMELIADQRQIVDGSFFYLRFAGSATLDLGDGRAPLRATLVSEHLAPRALRWRWLDWLIDMRIGKNKRPSFLP